MTSDTQRSELLPCPFCGSEPELYSVSDGADIEIGLAFRCDDCNIEKPGVQYQEAVEAWNRRPPPKVGSGELDAAGLAKLIESARGKAAVFADTNPTFAEIERELRAASALLGPKSFINDTVVFAAPVDHPEVVGDEHHEFEAVMLEALLAIQAGCVLPPQEQELLDRALAGAKAGAGVMEPPWQEKFRATLQKDSGASVFRDEQGAVQVRFSDEVAWLIERKRDADWPHPRWYAENDKGFHWWTALATEAKQFATEAEAGTFPAYQMIAGDPTISITEHVFLGSDSPALEAGVADKAKRVFANPCIQKLGDDEPFFVLLGRDRHAAAATRAWADLREAERGVSHKTTEAREIASEMDQFAALSTPAKEDGK